MTINKESYTYTSWIFLRGIGFIYLIAFLSFYTQHKGLIGSEGILPFSNYLASAQSNLGSSSYLLIPAINWINDTDIFIKWQLLFSILCSTLLIAGIFPLGTSILLWISYLSIVNIGQIFMSYQWDALLLEAGFLTIFICPLTLISRRINAREPSRIMVFLFSILLFKLMFSSGIGKIISGDETWRNLKALDYHYVTQPIPNPISWYIHQLPHLFHKLSVLITLVIEIVIPIFYFFKGRLKYIAGAITIVFQLIIFLTGNYTYFNLLTICLCIFLYDDKVVRPLILNNGVKFRNNYTDANLAGSSYNLRKSLLILLAITILFFNIFQFSRRYLGLRNTPKPVASVARYISVFRIANNYGLFTVMTTKRPEIVIEGSNDGTNWFEYSFKYKPVDPKRSLPFVAPHQPRLDWQMWFAALGDYRTNPWIINLVYRIKYDSKDVINLFNENPFPDKPPIYLRAVLYEYSFTSREERKQTGAIWKREYQGFYLPSII